VAVEYLVDTHALSIRRACEAIGLTRSAWYRPLVRWCKAHGIFIDYIEQGKPNQNAYIERFNKSYRNEVLNTWLFRTLDEVRELTWAWMLEYNEDRDHDGLGGLTPIEALQQAKVSTFGLST
jgi:putative transposase